MDIAAIPDISNFFSTGTHFGSILLHAIARKSPQNRFRDMQYALPDFGHCRQPWLNELNEMTPSGRLGRRGDPHSHTIEGDIVLSPRQAAQFRASALNYGPQKRHPSPRVLTRSGHVSRNWPRNTYKYEFVKGTFTGVGEWKVRKAIQDFEREISSVYPPLKKCITFLEEDPGAPGRRVKIIGGPVRCSSNLGFGGGWQMELGGDWNYGCLKPSTIKHELLHSLGISHQHARSDRNKSVEIIWGNINNKSRHNFNMYDNKTVNSHGIPYDFMSIMHYEEYAMSNYANSNNTNMTIRAHDTNTHEVASWTESKGFAGSTGGPRLTDIELVRRMYKCDQLDLSKVELPNEMPNKDSGCKYFRGDNRTPTSIPGKVWFVKRLAENLAESWFSCQKLCFDIPECTEWTMNYRTGACTVGKKLLQKVLS